MLLLENFPRNHNRAVRAALKVLEVMLLSSGLFSTLLVLKSSKFVHKSCDLVFSSLLGFWNSLKCTLSSPIHVCVIIIFTILMIRLSYTPLQRESSNPEDDQGYKANIESILLPPPPPISSLIPQSPPLPLPSAPPLPSPSAPPLPSPSAPSPSPQQPELLTCILLQPPPSAPLESELPPLTSPLPPRPPKPSKERVVLETPEKGGTQINTTTSQVDDYHDPKVLHVIMEQGCDKKSSLSSSLPSLVRQEPIPQIIMGTKPSSNSTPNFKESTNSNMKTNFSPSKRRKKKPEGMVESNYPHNEECEDEDSMEATWRMIMGGGKQKTKKQPLKKSETWDVPPSPCKSPIHRLDSELVVPSSPKWREMREAESFNDAISMRRRGGLVRKGSSMSLDDFNKQIEDFINKFKRKTSTSEGKKPSKGFWK